MRARRTDEGGGVECATDAKSPSRRKLIFMAAVRKRGGRVTRFTICVGKYVLLDQFREGGPYLKAPTVEIAQRAISLGCPTHV